MYQLNLRAQASKLASLAAQWQAAGAQQRAAAEPRRRASSLRAVLAGLANLATLRTMPGAWPESPTRHDLRESRNW